MKTVEILKEREFEPQFEALLRGLLGRVPFLKLASLRKDARVFPGSPYRADRLAQVTAGDRKWTLVSDVQIYLDLLRGGLRGEEQAEELRRWPDFAGGWA